MRPDEDHGLKDEPADHEPSESATFEQTVAEVDAGQRLDRWLAAAMDVARNKVQRWIKDGQVTVADAEGRPATVKPGAELRVGDRVRCTPPTPEPTTLAPEDGPLVWLHQDTHLWVLDKPAGLSVHPGAGRSGGTLANRLLHHDPGLARVGGPGRPGIVHRLDLDTTGALAVARTEACYQSLSRAFAARRVGKLYLAVVHGVPPEPTGTIDLPIDRHPTERKKMTVRPGGRPARSRYRVLAHLDKVASVVAVGLDTGRTHQIRVHLKAVGHPLVGDPVYGEARWKGLDSRFRRPLERFPRPALHAWRLVFDHPVLDGERIDCTAPVPDDLHRLWRGLWHGTDGGDLPSEAPDPSLS